MSVDCRCEVNVTIDTVSFPLQNALFAGQKCLDPAAACYVRYKFYDRGIYYNLDHFLIIGMLKLNCGGYCLKRTFIHIAVSIRSTASICFLFSCNTINWHAFMWLTVSALRSLDEKEIEESVFAISQFHFAFFVIIL
jgi:hypothetical protein